MQYFLSIRHSRMLVIALLFLSTSIAQSQPQESPHIQVTVNKTSSLVFPSVIIAVDRGSRDVLAQKATGVNNVLQLKAARPNFRETNLTVITGDGKLHEFTVTYAQNPTTMTINTNAPGDDPTPLLFETVLTESGMKATAEKILTTAKLTSVRTAADNGMRLSLRGIYIQQETMFCHLEISNTSNIPYTTDLLRLFIRDQKKPKRTAVQENPVAPLYIYRAPNTIPGKSTIEAIFAIPKVTIPDAKRLFIELTETNGGRNLKLAIRNRAIIRAKNIR